MIKTANYTLLGIFVLLALAFSGSDANAQSYAPVGPQLNVPSSTVINGGWVECYRDTYNNSLSADEVLSQCPGQNLMLACTPTGSDALMLLAWAPREDVIFNTGDNTDVTHIANGSGWYFSTELGSWGFVTAGEVVDKNECDFLTEGDDRLCWHLAGGGGWRCGNMIELNDSTEYERIVYMAESEPAQVPTLSEWGLIAMAGVLGIVGFMVARRRKAAA